MRSLARNTKSARLSCEVLEDRMNPVAAFTLSGVGLGTANLLAFDTASPTITTSTPIVGLATNETLVGMDFRPQNGHLYALGVTNTTATTNTGTLYDISIRTGRATPVGGANGLVTTTDGLPNPTTAGVGYAFDVNPLVDRIRVIASDGDNFAINPNSGTTAANQTSAGTTNLFTGTSYTNNAPNLTATTEYVISSATDSLLAVADPANPAGTSTLVGTLGIGDFNAVNGFDIPAGVNATTSGTAVTSGTAFANLNVGGTSRLYTINLVTGAATLVGTIGSGGATTGVAIQNDYNGYAAIGVSSTTPGAANLVRFNTSTPGTTVTVAVTGLVSTERLVGVAYRPATGQLYGLGVDAGGVGSLYVIDPQTGAVVTATPLTAAMGVTLPTLPNPATAGYGFAFNATVDAIRVITTANQSFAILPNTAVVASVAPAVTGATVDSATYTNSFGQAAGAGNPTTLYVLDSATDRLLIMNPATSVATPLANVTLGGAPLNFTNVTGFDIPAGVTSVSPNGSPAPANSIAYATLVVGTTPGLYRINLTTGVATLTGTLSTTLTGLSLSDTPGGVVNFGSATFTGNEGGAVSVTLTRTAATGPQTATVFVSGGGANGSDRASGPFTVNFAEGATTATVNIPLTADQLTEGTETFTLSIAAPGAVIGTTPTATVNINDTSTTPPPVFAAAQQVGNFLVTQGTGGTQVVQLPPGSVTLFADLTGDGVNDVILFLPTLVTVINGQTGQFSLLSFDDNGDGFRDLLVFNANGTTTRTDGRTGIVVTQ